MLKALAGGGREVIMTLTATSRRILLPQTTGVCTIYTKRPHLFYHMLKQNLRCLFQTGLCLMRAAGGGEMLEDD